METLRRLSSLKVLTCKARATDASSKQELRVNLPAALQRELREMFDVLDKDHSGSVRLPPSALGSPLPHLHRVLGITPLGPSDMCAGTEPCELALLPHLVGLHA